MVRGRVGRAFHNYRFVQRRTAASSKGIRRFPAKSGPRVIGYSHNAARRSWTISFPRGTPAQAILKNLGVEILYLCTMAKLVYGMHQSLDGYVDHLEFRPSLALLRLSIMQREEAIELIRRSRLCASLRPSPVFAGRKTKEAERDLTKQNERVLPGFPPSRAADFSWQEAVCSFLGAFFSRADAGSAFRFFRGGSLRSAATGNRQAFPRNERFVMFS